MTDDDTQPDLPGNDGRWFLEIVGVVPAEPSSKSTIATLEQPVLDAAAAAAIAAETTPEETDEIPVVGAAAGEKALRAYRPSELSKKLAGNRSFRWGMVALAAILAIAVLAAIVYVPVAANNRATTTANSYGSALVDYRNNLPGAQAAVIVLGDPAASESDLDGVIPATADLQEHAGTVTDLATEPLPATLPFAPRNRIDALEPTRSSMLVLGAEGQDIAERMGRGYVYRTTVPNLLATGELPTEGDAATVDRLSVDFAAVLAETSGLASDLPEDPLFDQVKWATAEAAEWFATWQLDYLDALRSSDADAAAELVAELEDVRIAIAETLAAALDALGRELNEQIIVLAGGIEETIASIPG